MEATIDLMAKRKNTEPFVESVPAEPSLAKTGTIRVDADLAEMITHISIRRKTGIAKIVSPRIREWVEAMYAEVLDEMKRLPKRGDN